MSLESGPNSVNDNKQEASLETLSATESPQGTTEHILTLEDGTRLTITGELKMQGSDHMSLTGTCEDGSHIQVQLEKEGDTFAVNNIRYPDQAQAA